MNKKEEEKIKFTLELADKATPKQFYNNSTKLVKMFNIKLKQKELQ